MEFLALSGSKTMHSGVRNTLLVCAVAMLLAPACSRDPSPGTPAAAAEGDRLMRQMSDALARASAFRFETGTPFLSSTTTSTRTRSAPVRKTGRCDCGVSVEGGGVAVDGGVPVDGGVAGGVAGG